MAYNILVVDDSQTMRAMLVKMLRMTDLELGDILVAVNGRDALEKLKDQWVDLVLTDLNMPDMTGVQLVEAMAGDGLIKSIPVIVISTDGSEERIAHLKQQGVREYVRKPFTPEVISEAIVRVLGGTHERSKA
jgi:two-component system chemotaxis response regulator CheY